MLLLFNVCRHWIFILSCLSLNGSFRVKLYLELQYNPEFANLQKPSKISDVSRNRGCTYSVRQVRGKRLLFSEVRKTESSRNPLYNSNDQTECVRISVDFSHSCSPTDYSITGSSIFLPPEARARFPFLFTRFLVFLGDWILTLFVLFLLERSLDFLVYASCEYLCALLSL